MHQVYLAITFVGVVALVLTFLLALESVIG
jgi:hypothetical protein